MICTGFKWLRRKQINSSSSHSPAVSPVPPSLVHFCWWKAIKCQGIILTNVLAQTRSKCQKNIWPIKYINLLIILPFFSSLMDRQSWDAFIIKPLRRWSWDIQDSWIWYHILISSVMLPYIDSLLPRLRLFSLPPASLVLHSLVKFYHITLCLRLCFQRNPG